MVSAVEAITGRVREGLCFILDNVEDAARVLGDVVGTAAGVGAVAGALGAQVCNKPPEPLELPEPPFEGGQCPILYDVGYVLTPYDSNGDAGTPTVNSANGLQGPIGGVTYSSSCSITIVGPLAPNAGGFCAFISTATGPVLIGGNGNGGVSLSITGVTPVTGIDNCGDLPPNLPPPGNVTYEGDDITYEGDDNIEITVPIALIFAPVYVAIDGTLRIPVNIDVGGVNFTGNVTLAPEFNLEFSPTFPPAGPGSPEDPDVIGEPGEPSEPIPDEEELESTIIGVLVFSDIDPDGQPSGVLFQDGPNLFVPRAASVQFAIKTKDSIGWTSDQDVKSLECYVPCPAPQGAIAVRVSPMPGVQSRFTPVRGKPLTSF